MTTLLRLLRPLVILAALQGPVWADDVQAMRTALDVAATKEWDSALAVAPAGVGHDIILWQKLRDGEGLLGEYEDFFARHPDWPGLPLMKEKGETAVARTDNPARVVAFFGADVPQTADGAIALVRALKAQGQTDLAETEAMRAWVELSFDTEEEAALLTLEPQALARVHVLRLDNLLWNGSRVEAERMLPRVDEGWQKLARARMALRAGAKGASGLIDAVPKSLRGHPGLAFERFVWRMKKDLYDDAADLIADIAPEDLGRPEVWADRRATLVRWLLRNDRPKDAYRIASRHGLVEGTDYADLEFLSGFIALRRLGDPATALTHFNHLKAEVSTPISLARAAYWQGRAEEAAGQSEAAVKHYQTAARNQTAFYGLMAAEKLGLKLDAGLLDSARPADWRNAAFATSTVLDAARLLIKAGDRTLAKRFFLHLAESLDAGELAQLADLALSIDEPHIAVLIGKSAAERGVIIPRAYYPVTDMVPDGLSVSRALALSIARRESEFDPAARSKADARGLMQVLPATAKHIAGELGLAFDAGKLLTDPSYNAKIGSAYLAKMVDEFGPSIALIASGYNAGPGRPRKWIAEFGDPRDPSVDIVDWVETIPFTETRTYVMRVAEGVVIYRARLKGQAGPVRITSELRG